MLVALGQPTLVASRRSTHVSGPAELERAGQLLADSGDRHGQAIALRTLGNALRRRGQLTRPLAVFHEALTHYEASGDALGRWQTLRFIGQTQLDLGALDEAMTYLRAAELAAHDLGRPRLRAQTSYWLGQVHLAKGDGAPAQAAFTTVLDEYPEPVGLGHAYAAHGLGQAALLAGNLTAAGLYLDDAVALAHDAADSVLEGRVHRSIAQLRRAEGDLAGVRTQLESAVACFGGGDTVLLHAQALLELSRTELELHDDEAAQRSRSAFDDLLALMDLPPADRDHLFDGPHQT